MPTIKCIVCKDRQQVLVKDWKLVSKVTFDQVCSIKCFMDWVQGGTFKRNIHKMFNVKVFSDTSADVYSHKLKTFFRSKYEVHVAECLYAAGISFWYEKIHFNVGSSKLYIPDFFLPNHCSFIEVKGIWGSSSKSKYAEFKKMYPDVRILLLSWLVHKEFY